LADPIDWLSHLKGMHGLVHAAALADRGRKMLMRAAVRADIARVVYVSSVRAIIGASADEVIGEDHPPEPTND
jgi:UDP-glucose 4-epimerase